MATYAYYRVSTKTQAEKNSTKMQMDVIKKHCEENNIFLVGSFEDEGVSGTIENRDGLLECIANLESGDRILVQNTSRLWRKDTVKVFVVRELQKIGADIISIEQPNYTIYEKEPSNKLFNAIMEALDEYDRDIIAMKLAKGRRARAKSGNKPCGTAPYGYKWQGNEIVIDFNNNLIVQDIFRQYIELKSLAKLKAYCDGKEYKTSTGKDFSKQALKNIIENDFYIGIVTYAGKKTTGEHEPIVEKSVFDKANEILKR